MAGSPSDSCGDGSGGIGSVTLRLAGDDGGGSWAEAARGRFATIDDAAREFRRESGLPGDAPIVMGGHQPGVWHPGILAKWFATIAAARAAGGVGAWVVVDQDEVDPWLIRAPVVGADGELREARVRIAAAPMEGVAAACAPAARVVAEEGHDFALGSVREGVARVRASARAHTGGTLAEQAHSALVGEVSRVDDSPLVSVFATSIARTGLFRELCDRMRREPERAVGAYNEAVAWANDAGLAPLAAAAGRWELPVWGLREGRARRRVDAGEWLRDGERAAPRALFLTLILRLAGCDLFVHGLGGERYERATERWAGAWLGRRLAPMGVATATVRLPLRARMTEREIAERVWLAHRAMHDPSVVGDEASAREKRALVERIERAEGEERARVFRETHALLARYREEHARELGKVRAEAERAEAMRGEARVASEREWSIALHGKAALEELRGRVEKSEAVGGR